MIVDFLSIYLDPVKDIERELIQLVYYGNLSYYDTLIMTYPIRQFWIDELRQIKEEEEKRKQDLYLQDINKAGF